MYTYKKKSEYETGNLEETSWAPGRAIAGKPNTVKVSVGYPRMALGKRARMTVYKKEKHRTGAE